MYKEMLPPWHQEKTQELYSRCCNLLEVLQSEIHETNEIIRGKYNDYYTIPSYFVNSIIKEFGYEYIVKVLNWSDEDLKDMLSYIAVIQAMKGHREGLELVFKLMEIDYTLKEWWEESPKDTPDTFNLSVRLDLARIRPDTSDRLRDFIENYVYPKLHNLKFEMKALIFDMIVTFGGMQKTYSLSACQGLSWNMVASAGVTKYINKGELLIDFQSAGIAPYLLGETRMFTSFGGVRKHTITGKVYQLV